MVLKKEADNQADHCAYSLMFVSTGGVTAAVATPLRFVRIFLAFRTSSSVQDRFITRAVTLSVPDVEARVRPRS